MINFVNTAGADALLLLDEADMHYVCGFSPSEGMILVTPTAVFQLVDSRYTETARLHAADTGVQVTEITTGFWDELDALLAKIDCKILLFEDRTIAYRQYTQLQGIFSGELRPVGNGVMDLRNVKEPWEIDLMKTANRIAEKAFLELLNDVKPGKTEKELAARFDYLMALGGSDGVSFDTILLTGAHTSMPHGVPENREVQKGDFVLFDFGATYRGYHSDMTRTVAVGHVTEEMETERSEYPCSARSACRMSITLSSRPKTGIIRRRHVERPGIITVIQKVIRILPDIRLERKHKEAAG